MAEFFLIAPTNIFDCATSQLAHLIMQDYISKGHTVKLIEFDARPYYADKGLSKKKLKYYFAQKVKEIGRGKNIIFVMDIVYLGPINKKLSAFILNLVDTSNNFLFVKVNIPDEYRLISQPGFANVYPFILGLYKNIRDSLILRKLWKNSLQFGKKKNIYFQLFNSITARHFGLVYNTRNYVSHPLILNTSDQALQMPIQTSKFNIAVLDSLDESNNISFVVDALRELEYLDMTILANTPLNFVEPRVAISKPMKKIVRTFSGQMFIKKIQMLLGTLMKHSEKNEILDMDKSYSTKEETNTKKIIIKSFENAKLKYARDFLVEGLDDNKRSDAFSAGITFNFYKDFDHITRLLPNFDLVVLPHLPTEEHSTAVFALAAKYGKNILCTHIPLHHILADMYNVDVIYYDLGNEVEIRNKIRNMYKNIEQLRLNNVSEGARQFTISSLTNQHFDTVWS